jgi:hypothetical protein
MLPPTSEGGDSVPDKLLEVSLLVVVEITGGLTGSSGLAAHSKSREDLRLKPVDKRGLLLPPRSCRLLVGSSRDSLNEAEEEAVGSGGL